MAETERCLVHFSTHSRESGLKCLNQLQLDTIKRRAELWSALLPVKQPEKAIADDAINKLSLESSTTGRSAATESLRPTHTTTQHEEDRHRFYSHNACFTRFTSLYKYNRAKSQKRKIPEPDEATPASTEIDDSQPASKTLRSQSSVKSYGNILPSVCIICQKEIKLVKKGWHRIRDKLSKAETKGGGGLIQAAILKNDHDVLLHIPTHDCVASEVCYHPSCHKKYIKTNYGSTGVGQKVDKALDTIAAWKGFASFIESSVLEEKKAYRLTHLHKIFLKFCEETSTADPSANRSSWLSYHMKRTFPQLAFHQPHKANQSVIVANMDTPLRNLVSDDGSINLGRLSTTSATDDTSPEDTPLHIQPAHSATHDALRLELFHSATFLNSEISDKNATNRIPWPPKHSDLTVEKCLQSIPPSLFNHVALITASKDTFDMSPDRSFSSYMPLPMNLRNKVISICQDIMHLQSRGTKPTPKALGLGLTLRHLTGSKHISNLLSGFGHSASYDSILRVETALAVEQAMATSSVPPGFVKHKFTVLVYDNIDFAEETLSGAGTTHHTNGIMIQLKKEEIPLLATIEAENMPRTSNRSFQPVQSEIAPFYVTSKHGPDSLSDESVSVSKCLEIFNSSKTKDAAFIKMKSIQREPCLPGWTAFNINIANPLPCSAIHYLPVIEAPPTDQSTIKHILVDAMNHADILECDHVMVVFDQAIYSKAQQLRWTDKNIEQRLVLRLGEFHTVMSYLSAIGKRFKMSGLEDILIEANVVAPGSMNGVLSGHMYNRSIRAHKQLFEALSRLQLAEFFESLNDMTREQYEKSIHEAISHYTNNQELAVEKLAELEQCFVKYVEEQSNSKPTYNYWRSYLDMVYVLLAFMRATRTGDWKLHLASLRLMLPWMFAYDRTNYARYAPAYWLEMQQLESSHSWLYNQLMNNPGCWTTQHQAISGFSSMASDQTIETTVNRASKTSGGVRGITLSQGSVQRWIFSQPAKAAISATTEEMAGIHPEYRAHKEADKTRIKKDEESIQHLQLTLGAMINPWTESSTDGIISLSSGVIADKDVQRDIDKAHEIGGQQAQEFIEKRLITRSVDFFAPIKTNKLKTFATSTKKKSTSQKQIKADRATFARLVIVAKTRNINMKTVLCYPLSSISAALASSDGQSISKTVKSTLLTLLEEKCKTVSTKSLDDLNNTTIIVDAMAIVQSFPRSKLPNTFGEFAELLLQHLVMLAGKFSALRVDFVGDQYLPVSIKNLERQRRMTTGSSQRTVYGSNQAMPKQWNKFLANGPNKTTLQSFIAMHWENCTIGRLLDIYVAVERECKLLTFTVDTKPTASVVPELTSDHEEADTRLILHTAHAHANNFTDIIIHSPDTDVAILALSFAPTFEKSEVFFATGVGNRKRVLPITAMAQYLGIRMTSSLIGVHAISGCDSVSSFHGKGKKACLQLASEDEYNGAISKLGKESFTLSEESFEVLEKYVCALYRSKSDKVNDARYQLFCSNAPEERSLPPTEDCLRQHISRTCYQARIWNLSTSALMDCPSPIGHGWHMADGQLAIKWMDGNYAPAEILQMAHCGCRTSMCRGGNCSCLRANLKCSDLCNCGDGCENVPAANDGECGQEANSDSEEEI